MRLVRKPCSDAGNVDLEIKVYIAVKTVDGDDTDAFLMSAIAWPQLIENNRTVTIR